MIDDRENPIQYSWCLKPSYTFYIIFQYYTYINGQEKRILFIVFNSLNIGGFSGIFLEFSAWNPFFVLYITRVQKNMDASIPACTVYIG